MIATDERLSGNNAANQLNGANGNDKLAGDAGGDRFDFNAVTESGPAAALRDTVTDFQQGTDKIDVSTIDAVPGAPTMPSPLSARARSRSTRRAGSVMSSRAAASPWCS